MMFEGASCKKRDSLLFPEADVPSWHVVSSASQAVAAFSAAAIASSAHILSSASQPAS